MADVADGNQVDLGSRHPVGSKIDLAWSIQDKTCTHVHGTVVSGR